MPLELKVPSVGESITEVQIGAWLKRVGEPVRKDESLVEIESDKATAELPAPADGVLTQVLEASAAKKRRSAKRSPTWKKERGRDECRARRQIRHSGTYWQTAGAAAHAQRSESTTTTVHPSSQVVAAQPRRPRWYRRTTTPSQ